MIATPVAAVPTFAPSAPVVFSRTVDAGRDAHLIAGWDGLLKSSDHVYRIYQSPEWWSHLVSTRPADDLLLGVLPAQAGAEVGVVPMDVQPYALAFGAGRHTIMTLKLRAAHLLGGAPLASGRPAALADVVDRLWRERPDLDALFLKGVPAGCEAWAGWEDGLKARGNALLYSEHGKRPLYTIALPDSFDAYLARFGSKKRYNLRRQVRVLEEQLGGLELVRVEREEQVEEFVRQAQHIAQRTWQHQAIGPLGIERADIGLRLADLARRGLLRSYVLRSGGRALAFVLGYQGRGVFHYADIGHDAGLSKFSPGTVLLYRLIEDLIAHQRPQTLNFGIGVSEYKRQFATEVREETSLLILRDTLANRVRVGLHRGWRGLLARLKPLLRRPKLVLAGVLSQEGIYELIGSIVNSPLPLAMG